MLGIRAPRRLRLPSSSVQWGLLAWLYFVVLWLTWTPVSDSPPSILWLPPRMSARALLGNLLLFAPIGAVLAASSAQRRRSTGFRDCRYLMVVAAAVAVLSATVEVGQLRVPGRNVSPYDVILNVTGALMAAWVVHRVVRSGVSAGLATAVAGASVFVGVLVFVSATGFATARMTVLSSWQADYGVLVGDEFGGGREYFGEVSRGQICGGHPGEGICVQSGAPREDREALIEAAQSSQRIRLSGLVTSYGPQPVDARIITFSADTEHRNATLFQRDRDLVLRLRTRAPGGTGVQFLLPDAIQEGVITSVEGTYEPGRVHLIATTDDHVLQATFPLGYFSGWWMVKDNRDSRVQPTSLRIAWLVAVAAFALPLGLLAVSWTAPSLGLRVLLAGGLPAAVLIPLTAALAIPSTLEEVLASTGFGLLGGLLGSLTTSNRVSLDARELTPTGPNAMEDISCS